MPAARRFQAQGYEKTDLPLLARINIDGEPVVQADLNSAVTYSVLNSSGSTMGTATLAMSNIVYNTLQVDDRWERDSTGYNVRATIPGALFSAPGYYSVEINFDPISGSDFVVAVDAHILGLDSK